MKSAKHILNDLLGLTGHMLVRKETVANLANLQPGPVEARKLRDRLLDEFIANAPDRIDLRDFANHCLRNIGRSRSQWPQDLWVMNETGGKRDGFFVEFGAADGLASSNTLMLEKDLNWRGVLCEPVPSAYDELVENRPDAVCVHAAVSVDDRPEYAFSVVPHIIQLSTISAFKSGDLHADLRAESTEITVPAIDVNDLIAKGEPADNVVDYLSIDTEGGELEILQRVDFDRWRIRTITVEHNLRKKEMKEIPDLLAARNFERIDLVSLNGWDFWFRNRDFQP
jgi:FkbM family methyltransferase